MSEPIKFFASVDQVQGGDEEVRLVLLVKDSPADLAAAVNMLGKLNRVLRVAAYLGSGEDTLAEFVAAIPQIKTGVQFRSTKPPVIKLDIPARDATKALRLVGYNERIVRFEVEDEGEKPTKEQRPKAEKKAKRPKGPYAYFWEYLHPDGGKGGAGFHTLPGVREAIERLRRTDTEPVWELLHRVFGVGGYTLAYTSPQQVFEKFEGNTRVAMFVERAMKFQEERLKQIANMEGQDG